MTIQQLDATVAVVTGAASGLGGSLAGKLCEAGASVVLADVNGPAIEAFATSLRNTGRPAVACVCDVSDRSQIENLAQTAWDTFGRVDLLFNNAGVINAPALLEDIEPATIDWVLRVNIGGVINGCAVFVKRFKAQGGPAHIVNVGSEHSVGVPFGRFVPYTASKHAILGISDVLRQELANTEIGVSIMCPSGIATDLWQAEARRPAEFGGPGPNMERSKRAFDAGMAPDVLADLALNAVRTGDFYVLSHANVRAYHDRRVEELSAEFDRQLGSPNEPNQNP